MNLKTDYAYNDDDFIQCGENIDELTVTITLCEYRNLVQEQVRLDMRVEQLLEEKATLEEKLKDMSKALFLCKLPDWMKSIGNTIAHWGENEDDDSEECAEAEDDGTDQ